MAEGRKSIGSMRERLLASRRRDDEAREQIDGLRERIHELEREVQENRELNRRVAELTDIVTELLIPIADRDTAKVNDLLAKYRDEI